MKRVIISVVMLGLSPHMAVAQEDVSCIEIAGILEKAVEEWPDLLSTVRVKPRMAAVKIATNAGVALPYAVDAGWTDEEQAPIVALRDTREGGMEDPAFAKDKVPTLLLGYLLAIGDVVRAKCPETDVADISDLSTEYPDN